MANERLTWKGFGLNLELARWRDEEFESGSIKKAKRIQKVLDKRREKYGIRPPYSQTIADC